MFSTFMLIFHNFFKSLLNISRVSMMVVNQYIKHKVSACSTEQKNVTNVKKPHHFFTRTPLLSAFIKSSFTLSSSVSKCFL